MRSQYVTVIFTGIACLEASTRVSDGVVKTIINNRLLSIMTFLDVCVLERCPAQLIPTVTITLDNDAIVRFMTICNMES